MPDSAAWTPACQSGYFAPGANAHTEYGMSYRRASWVFAMAEKTSSVAQAVLMPPLDRSMVAAYEMCIVGVPGASVCRMAMPDRISAFAIATMPATDSGAEAAASGIAQMPTGIPASANTRMHSTGPSSQWSGLIEHWKFDRIGRARSASEPPATTRAISTMPRAFSGSIAVICWMCFVVFGSWACVSWIGRTGTGVSFALTGCQWNAICGSASASRVIWTMSRFVPGRRLPVSRSITSAGHPSVARYPAEPSSGRSSAGSRAASM